MIANGGTGGLGINVPLNTPINSGGGTASGGTTNQSGADGIRDAGDGGNSGSVITIFGTGGIGRTNNSGLPGGNPGAGGGGGEKDNASGGTNYPGGAGANGQVSFHYIGVTNITSPACIGSTITFTGFNFAAGATTVTINGTPCTGVTVVNPTTITAVIAAGTISGNVVINNPNGTNNGINITVNPLPTIVTVTGTTPACTSTTLNASNGSSGTIYWQNTTSNGTSTATASTSQIVSASGTYYFRARSAAGCWGPEGSITVTINSTPTITTNPSNVAVASGANTSFTAAGTSSPSYTWEVSTNGGGTWSTVNNGGVYSNATTATLNITGVLASMDGYQYRATATNSCGSAVTTVATLTVTLSYCTSSGGNTDGINRVIFNTIDNTPGGTVTNVAYTNYTAVSTTVTKGNTYNLSVYVNTVGNYTDYQSAYIDWNKDGDFVDAGEYYDLGHVRNVGFGLSGISPYPITIPLNATTGSTRMRIQSKWNGKTTGPCETGFDGEVEDYTLNIISNPSACSIPTSQPSALALASANGVSISGSFTAASPAPDHYLVVRSTNNTPPVLVPGTFYAIGSTIGAAYTVVDNDTNTSFFATGLTANTLYYIYVFSYNGTCTGGPLYNVTTPLTGSITTANNAYCAPTSLINTNYIAGISSVGTLNDVSNGPTGYSSDGYANYTGITIARQIPAGGINININLTGTLGQFVLAYVDWNNDGDFIDAGETVYTTGTTATGDTSFGFVVPGTQAAGNYRMRIRTRSFGDDSAITSCAQGYTTGETEDYTIQVQADCAQKITSVTNGAACGPTNTVNLSAVSAGATGFRWYATETGATLIQDVVGSGNWTTPSISTTTTYYVTAYNGTCESLYRTPVTATIQATTNITVTPSVPEVCGPGDIIQVTAGGDTITEEVLVQNFETGMAPFVVTNPLATGSGADTPWSVKPSTYQPLTTTVWKPAVNSGAVATTGNRFAFTTSDYNNSNIITVMTSPVIDAGVYSALTLTFDHYYSYYGGDKGEVQVSNDNFTTTTTVRTYTSDIGSASKFAGETIDLSAFAGLSNVRVRFVYTANWDDGWAIDNFKLTGVKPVNTTFTWSGGSVDAYIDNPPTIPYVAQSVSTIYILATQTQLEQANWSFTATATLGNGCPVSKLISVTNKTKVWKGTIDNNWNNAGNWSPNVVPDATNCVIIPSATSAKIMNLPNAFAKNVTVQAPTGNLELQTGRNLTVTDWINVESGATFDVRNAANLIQVNNVANIGSINMQRNANIKILDYVYWSTPVAGFASSAISPLSSHIYKWLPTTVTGYAGDFGNWAYANEAMITGRGYIVRAPNTYSSTPSNFTATFTGVPNNGDITTGISRSTYVGGPYTGPTTTPVTANDDNWNLVGNPYPSSISADAFLAANNTKIPGWIRIWTHGTAPTTSNTNQFYQNYKYNYSSSDYLTYNYLGGTISGFDGYIPAGQSFFVLMLDAAATPNTLSFTNSMRNSTYRNDQFFRTTDSESLPKTEKHRIWLDLLDVNKTHSRTLVGYANEATNNYDEMYDAKSTSVDKVKFDLYSMIDKEEMRIQGKGLPFMQSDKIALGFSAPKNDIYTIAIADTDGLFKDKEQQILLEDTYLKVTHELSADPYEFSSEKGRFNDRFILKYSKKETTETNVSTASNVNVYTTTTINVKSTDFNIKNIEVFDIQGKKLVTIENVNKKELEIAQLRPTLGALLVRVTLENGDIQTKKIIY